MLKGVGGDDVLDGTFDDDTLIGGAGLDTLTGGGQADTFVWSYTSETGVQAATADRITDFNFADGDRISLSGIDADIYADGNQAFGTLDFTLNLPTPANSDVLPGEIRYYHVDGNTYIEMNTGDNPNVEGVIRIEGIVDPQASWFVL